MLVPGGGNLWTLRAKTAQTWVSARRTVAVEATILGKTVPFPFPLLHSPSMATSYKPTQAAEGPVNQVELVLDYEVRSGQSVGRHWCCWSL